MQKERSLQVVNDLRVLGDVTIDGDAIVVGSLDAPGIGTVTGTGTDNRLMSWDGTGDAQDASVGVSTLNGLTEGSLLFGGAGGLLAQANATLAWIDGSLLLRVGPLPPASNQGSGLSIALDGAQLWVEGGGGSYTELVGYGHRGTIASPTVSLANDTAMRLSSYGVRTTGSAVLQTEIDFGTDIAPTVGNGVQGRISLFTTDALGSLLERLRITSKTSAQVGTAGDVTNSGILIGAGVEIQNSSYLAFKGLTSGLVKIKPADAAGVWTLTLPTDDGSTGGVLKTDGSGVASWIGATAAHIEDADLTDVHTKFNTLLDALEAYGILASS